MRGPAILDVPQRSSTSCTTHYTATLQTAGGQLPAGNGSSASIRNSSNESERKGSRRSVNPTRTAKMHVGRSMTLSVSRDELPLPDLIRWDADRRRVALTFKPDLVRFRIWTRA